jgi:protein phosphatase
MTANPRPESGEIIVHVFGRTDVGRTREHNEDAFVVADLSTDNATLQPEVRTHATGRKGSLFMVADGMGGAAAGEIASAMAVEIVLGELRTAWIAQPATSAEAFVRALKAAAKTANEKINAYAAGHAEYRGMGTTATVAGLLGDTLYLAQVGDSRAYLVRDGVARQITKDQSLMQKLIEAGELTEEEARQSERRNIILQALGPEPTVKIDLTHQVVRHDDTLVLCSDGLSGQVTEEQIADVVAHEPDLMAACKQLIDLANGAGGPDNITVIIARFEGPGLRASGSFPAGDAAAADDEEIRHRVYPLPDTGQTPAMALDRVVDGHSPTQPVPAIPRPRTTRPLADRTSDGAHASDGAPSTPTVSARRRKAGQIIAVALLALLLAGAAWFVVHTARKLPSVQGSAAPKG